MTNLKKLLKEARTAEVYACTPGCEGRCRVCPAEVIRDLVEALKTGGTK